jgi:hypothetical protein
MKKKIPGFLQKTKSFLQENRFYVIYGRESLTGLKCCIWPSVAPPPRPHGKWTCMTLVLFVGNCANIVIVGRRRLMLNGSKAGGQIDGAETYLSLRYVNIVSRVQTVYYAFSIMHCTSNKISNLGHMHGLTTEETLRPRNIVI